jgi:hypothetical protein
MPRPDIFPSLNMPSSIRLETDEGILLADLRDETIRALAILAVLQGQSYGVLIEQAILNEDFLGRQEANGFRLIIEREGELRLLQRGPAPLL